MDVTESVHFNACYDGKSRLTEANLSRSKDAKGTTVQLAGLILICAACPVISAMAGSLETVLLAYTASILSTSSLVRERRAQAVCASNSHQSRISGITEHPSTRQTTDIFSFLCVATGMAFLGSLVGSSSLEVIRQTLLESYRAERVDLLVGEGSILGVTAIVFLFAGVAASFGLFPLHSTVQNTFNSVPGGLAVITTVLQRVQAVVVLWRVVLSSMPGFESTIQLLCIALGVSSCIAGAILIRRSESVRGLASNLWLTWGGIALISVATGLAVETPTDHQPAWQLPTGLATAAFAISISTVAVGMLLGIERWLFKNKRPIDFAEELTGLGQHEKLLALAVACVLLTMSAIPPLPGFWCAAFIVGKAFQPGVESSSGATLVPGKSVLTAVVLLLISLSALSAQSVHFLSLMFHREPIRRFKLPDNTFPVTIILVGTSLLVWVGMNAGTVLTWLHELPL